MDLKEAEKKLFKPEKSNIEDILAVDVPIVRDAAYDTGILLSNKLDDLEAGIRSAKKVGDLAWYVIACALTKIIDGGLYAQAGMTQSEYRKQIQQRLGIDARRVSDFLIAGRFLIQHGQKLLSMGWQPEGMQAKIKLASQIKGRVKNESKLLDAVMTKSVADLRSMLPKNKKNETPSEFNLRDGQLVLGEQVILSIAKDLPDDLRQDIEMFINALIDSRSHGGRITSFAVESRRQAQNAPRVFRDFTRGKFKKA